MSSSSQPPPLRRPLSSSAAPSTHPSSSDIVTSIQQANARLSAAAAAAAAASASRARSGSRDNDLSDTQLTHSGSVRHTAFASSALSRKDFPSQQVTSPPWQKSVEAEDEGEEPPRRSVSSTESVHTAPPHASARRSPLSQLRAYASPQNAPNLPSSPPSPPLQSSPRVATNVVASIDMSPPDSKPAARAAPVNNSVPPTSLEAELHRTRQQLEELQRLYSYEKRAHLQQRTRQLRDEAAQRHGEDNIVEQTAQLLTDYEALIRFRDVASAEHLQSILQHITDEWRRSAASLEETREACATSLLTRLQAASSEQHASLKATMQQQLRELAQKEIAAETAQLHIVADAVQEQVEAFKREYRDLVEQDMQERQRLMDTQVSRREEQWLRFLKEEHARMVATGEAAAQEASRRQLETLHLAMRDITQLRQTLLKEHAQRQTEVARAYMASYESIACETAAAAQETADFVQQLHNEYASVIHGLHEEIRKVRKESEKVEREVQQAEMRVHESMLKEQEAAKAEVETRWQQKLMAERDDHRAALARLAASHEEALSTLQCLHDTEDAERLMSFEKQLANLREELASQRDDKMKRDTESYCRLQSALHTCQAEKEERTQEVLQLKQQLYDAQAAREAAQQETRAEMEKKFASQLHALEEAYENALKIYQDRMQTTSYRGDSSSASATAAASSSTHLLQRVAELEKELHEAQQRYTTQLQDGLDDAAAVWSRRLKECQQRHTEELEAVAAQQRTLRQTLLADVRQREEAMEARCSAQRDAHHRELQEALQQAKEETARRLRVNDAEHTAAMAQSAADVMTRVQLREDALTAREEKFAEAQRVYETRRAEEQAMLRQQLLDEAAAQFEKQEQSLAMRERAVSDAQVDVARQLLTATQNIRSAVQQEAHDAYQAQLQAAQQQWQELTLQELQHRYAAWQATREAELQSILKLHGEEMNLLRNCHERQLDQLRAAHTQSVQQQYEEMKAREDAWAAERAASLKSFEEEAADRLRSVVEAEKAQWAALQRERAQSAHAELEAIAEHVASALARSEDERARVAEELREVYTAVVQDQEVKMSQHLLEVRAAHDLEKAKLLEDFNARLRQQAKTLQSDYAKQSNDATEQLRQLMQRHEDELTALRAAHASQLAEQRATAQDALQKAHAEARRAQLEQDQRMDTILRDANASRQKELQELRARCEQLMAQLRQKEAEQAAHEESVKETERAKLREEYESSMASLRAALEARNQSYAKLQASMYEQVQRETDRLQVKMDERYTAFTREQETKLSAFAAAQEAAHAAHQREHQEQLARLQHQHEAALTAQASTLRSAHDAACVELAAAFEAQQAEWKRLLEVEQAERTAAESTVRSLRAEMAALQVTEAQRRADALSALDGEYRHLLDAARAQLQEEREEVVKASLEEAEQHFLSTLLRPTHRSTSSSTLTSTAAAVSPSSPSAVMFSAPSHLSSPHHIFRSFFPPASTAAAAAAAAVPHTSVVAESSGNGHDDDDDDGTLAEAQRKRVLQVPTNTVMTPAHPHASPRPSIDLQPISPAAPQEYTLSYSPPPPNLVENSPSHNTQRLQQLWEVLEVPLEDRHAFLDLIDSLTATPDEQRRAWVEEERRLEAQLPLLEALTRREYVQRQLRSLRHAAPSLTTRSPNAPQPHGKRLNSASADGKGSSTSSLSTAAVGDAEKMLEKLEAELARLTKQLRSDVASHETQFGEVFRFNGKRVMEEL